MSIALLSAFAFSACSKSSSEQTGKSASEAHTMSELYGLQKVPTFELSLDEEAHTGLKEAPRTWVRADFRYGSQSYGDVGIRLKGHRSYRPIDDKPAIKLRFDKGASNKGRRFLEVRRLTLNNLVEDPTMIREYLAYRLARKVGLPVPKAGYANIVLNGESYGLYLVVETPDEDFLERQFGSAAGELYEGEYGCDLSPEDVEGFDLDHGDEARPALRALTSALARQGEPPWAGPSPLLDLEHLSTFLAFSTYVGDFDGYAHSHNYRIYWAPEKQSWFFMSWGLDRSFYKSLAPYASKGLMARACFGDASCRIAYLRKLREVHAAAQGLDLGTGARVIATLIAESVNADTRRPYKASKINEQREAIQEFIAGRDAFVREATACLDTNGRELDRDEDGYGCLDSNDSDAAIHPGAEELCDGIDNDGSGLADDSPACPCREETHGGRRLLFCDLPMPWTAARAQCEARGGRLASVTELASLEPLRALASKSDKGRWWIGANDWASEGHFVTSPGGSQEQPAELWAKTEPDNNTCNQDCAILHDSKSGRLHDTHCGQYYPFVCEIRAE